MTDPDDPPEYDDTGFTPDELLVLVWEAGLSIGWGEMVEYDGPEPPSDAEPKGPS